MALNNLDRFVAAARNPLALARSSSAIRRRCRRCCRSSPTSQHLSDLLISDPESFDLLRLTEGQPVSREVLVDEIGSEVATAVDERDVLARPAPVQAPRDAADRLRRHRPRQSLEVGHRADLLPGRRDLEAALQAALAEARAAARHAAAGRTATGAVRRAGHGQARRRGTELLQRHRPDLPLRRRRQDRRRRGRSPTSSSSTAWPARSSGY